MNRTHIKITRRDGSVVREIRSEHECCILTQVYNSTAWRYDITDALVEWDDEAWEAQQQNTGQTTSGSMPLDLQRCVDNGTHRASSRHTPANCPTVEHAGRD